MTEILNAFSDGFNAILITFVYLLSFPFVRIFLCSCFFLTSFRFIYRIFVESLFYCSKTDEDNNAGVYNDEDLGTYLNGEKYDG